MAKPGKRRGDKPRKRAVRPAAPARKPGAARTRRVDAAPARRRRAATPESAPPPVSPPLDLVPAGAPKLGDIPWGYGRDRVTAMARDPHWIFVYWELTDEAIERARGQVHAGEAACVLRVYDTTYRHFDGTNANWYVDVPVHRPANNHYVRVNRPAAVFHVDIGVKSHEGSFATIARSAPVETPRDSISPDTRVEWMTVTSDGERPREYRHRYQPAPGAPPAPAPPAAGLDLERVMRALAGEGWSRSEWEETDAGGRVVRWVRWTGPFRREHWRTVGAERVEIVVDGERRVLRGAWGERIVFGPWSVTIHALGLGGERRFIDRWTIHYAWPTEEGSVRVDTEPILRRILAGYRRVALGEGSEARLVELAWGSEALQAGASEWQWLRGSEARLGGELRALGASERLWLGASERLLGGASERLVGGASEWRFAGASEWLLGGASEWLLGGASERLLGGASERWP